jgi:hypothetical protein
VRQRGSTKLEHEKKMGLDPNMFEEWQQPDIR